jgi:hypothetical protein
MSEARQPFRKSSSVRVSLDVGYAALAAILLVFDRRSAGAAAIGYFRSCTVHGSGPCQGRGVAVDASMMEDNASRYH